MVGEVSLRRWSIFKCFLNFFHANLASGSTEKKMALFLACRTLCTFDKLYWFPKWNSWILSLHDLLCGIVCLYWRHNSLCFHRFNLPCDCWPYLRIREILPWPTFHYLEKTMRELFSTYFARSLRTDCKEEIRTTFSRHSYLFSDLTQECPDNVRLRSNLFDPPMIIYRPLK